MYLRTTPVILGMWDFDTWGVRYFGSKKLNIEKYQNSYPFYKKVSQVS